MDRRQFLAAGSAVLLSALLPGCRDDAAPPVEAGPVLPPDLRFGRLFDAGDDQLSDFAGRPLMINFWATWCPPCRFEMPALQSLSVRLAARGGLLIGVSEDQSPFPVREYLRQQRITFARHIDPARGTARRLEIADYPTTLVIDAAGRQKARMVGAANWEDPSILTTLGSLLGLWLHA